VAQISEALLRAWRQQPCQPVRLVVRVAGDLATRQAEVVSLGATVSHAFRLTNSLSLECAGSVALRLAQQPWVLSISPDTPVEAFGRQSHG
jgi:hypothetical protein